MLNSSLVLNNENVMNVFIFLTVETQNQEDVKDVEEKMEAMSDCSLPCRGPLSLIRLDHSSGSLGILNPLFCWPRSNLIQLFQVTKSYYTSYDVWFGLDNYVNAAYFIS